MKKEVYKIEGMTCAACSSAVERVTRKLEGVQESSVNLVAGKLTIVYDEALCGPQQIIAKVEKAGFGIKPYVDDKKRREEVAKKEEQERKEAKKRFLLAAVFAVPLLYIAMGHMFPNGLPLPQFLSMEEHPLTFALVQLFLTIPVLYFGRNFYLVGYKALYSGNPNMDTLVAVGTTAAFVYSVVMTVSVALGSKHAVHHLYYESAAVVITLIMLGKYMERKSKGKTSEAMKRLLELAPETAYRVENGLETEVEVSELEIGDMILVKPGVRVPVDGIIKKGSSSLEESMLTGESIPVEKAEGDMVIGGSMNCNGALYVEVTHTGEDTTLSKIVHLMEEAQGKKAPISKIADKVAGVFVPTVMCIALVAGIVWFFITKDISFALRIFVSVLVIACPCALGLATPTAIMVGTGLGASHGILMKSGEALEITHKIDTVILDKTGTITEGKPKVVETVSSLNAGRAIPHLQIRRALNGDRGMFVSDEECSNNPTLLDVQASNVYSVEKELLLLAGAVEAASEHPLAHAVTEAAKELVTEQEWKQAVEQVTDFMSTTGMGITANYAGKAVVIGNEKHLAEFGTGSEETAKEAKKMAAKGQTVVFVAVDGVLQGMIGIADTVKESSKEAIAQMKQMGIHVCMLTGDNRLAAEYIGKQVGVDEIIAEVLPADKAAVVEKKKAEGRCVMMVGDGINDAPALAMADVGTAIGSGSDIAIESADIVLMKSDLMDVSRAVRLSHLTIRNIHQNLFWAFFYNMIGIPVAAGLLYPVNGMLLSPMIGGFAMSLSSVCVVSNALRLRMKKL